MSSRIFVPTSGPESWQQLLAEPEKHWREGYSARTLAETWEAANGFPPALERAFAASGEQPFGDLELLLALPEYKTLLPGGLRPSQSDIFVLARGRQGLVAMTIEGKVSEPFGPLVQDWLGQEGAGKPVRLDFLCSVLGLDVDEARPLRYQLLHRTASALLEAERFDALVAAMVVHSFSPTSEWFDDYAAFARALGVDAMPGTMQKVGLRHGRELYLGWVSDELPG